MTYIWLKKVWINERIYYIRNVFSHWLRSHPTLHVPKSCLKVSKDVYSLFSACKLKQSTTHTITLQWSHNELVGVSNHEPHECLLNRLFKAQIKENIKAPSHRPLCGELTSDQCFLRTKGRWRGKCFHFMTSSYKPVHETTLQLDQEAKCHQASP